MPKRKFTSEDVRQYWNGPVKNKVIVIAVIIAISTAVVGVKHLAAQPNEGAYGLSNTNSDSGSSTPTPKRQPEYTYKTSDGYVYGISLSDITFDQARADPGKVNMEAVFSITNKTDGHNAPLLQAGNTQIVAYDTSLHPGCAYSKFKASSSECDLDGFGRMEMYSYCKFASEGDGRSSSTLIPGQSMHCTQSLGAVDESAYKQRGANAIKNTIVGYFGTKSTRLSAARCHAAYNEAPNEDYMPECRTGYTFTPGTYGQIVDGAYASDWHALNSRW
jgi:hypothetical protein